MQDQPSKAPNAQASGALAVGIVATCVVVGAVLWRRRAGGLDVALCALGVCVAVAVGRHVTRRWVRARYQSRVVLWFLDLLWAAGFALALVGITAVLGH